MVPSFERGQEVGVVVAVPVMDVVVVTIAVNVLVQPVTSVATMVYVPAARFVNVYAPGADTGAPPLSV